MALPLSARIAQSSANMNRAIVQRLSHLPASEYQSAPEIQYYNLPPKTYVANEAFPAYTENNYAQYQHDGMSAGQEPELKFAMTEPLELQLPTTEELAAMEWIYPDTEDEDNDQDAEGVQDDGADEGEGGNTEVGEDAEELDIDSGFHSQTENQQPAQDQPTQQLQQLQPASQPQQFAQIQPKLYIRFSTKKQQAKEATEAKTRDPKSPTIERKRPSTTPIHQLEKQHGGDTPSKRAKLEGGYFELKTLSSPAPPSRKGKKRRASPIETPTNEHSHRRPQKKAKIQNEHNVPKSSPYKKLSPIQIPKQKQKQKQKQKLHPVLSEQLESSPLPASGPVSAPPHRFSIQIPDLIVGVFENLRGSDLHVLPEIKTKGKVTSWTANQLTLLYIHSYIQDDIQLCDLIADVWIRAFQERNRSKKLPQMWCPNKSHPERSLKVKDGHMPDYHRIGLPNVPNWQQKLPLPTLGDDVTDFEPELLNALYHHTAEGNGARMLWADALALCGTKAEDWFLACKNKGIEVHPDLGYNVMCTTLRMCRRRLTLKIEETGKDTWCRRYHLHSKWGMACHRPMGEDKKLLDAQAVAPAPLTGNGGDIEVQDDLGADILNAFNNFDSEGDNNDLYDPPTPPRRAVDIDGGDGGDSSEED